MLMVPKRTAETKFRASEDLPRCNTIKMSIVCQCLELLAHLLSRKIDENKVSRPIN